MKTKIIFLILTFGIIVNVFSQRPTMELTFTAINSGQYVILDSIFIENLTTSGDTTLYSPDTVLLLDYITSVSSNTALIINGFSLSQNYPNPFKDKTTVNLYLPEKERIKIIVNDILGREVARYSKVLKQGTHSFVFICENGKTYLLTVVGEQQETTIKMLNANTNSLNHSECELTYNAYKENVNNLKTKEVTNNFVFNLGDQLRYIGFGKTNDAVNGSDTIDDTPMYSELYEFEITPLTMLATVNTINATNITQTSAICGGNVTSNGGYPVTARGVCWSTSTNPSLSDSSTLDGTGTGSFISNLSGLTGNTQYYVRAYATNTLGTNYGNVITFNTLPILPSVTTDIASSITQTTAVCGGNVTSNGGSSVTARGVCWSTTTNPTLSDSSTLDGTGTGAFISNLTGLIGNTLYYVRAYATNSIGTEYGNEISFTTAYSWMCGDPVSYGDKIYNTIIIGTQCWFKEDLNYGQMILGTSEQLDNGIVEKYCYSNDTNHCNTYGALYQWEEMMQYDTANGGQGICPSGWHIPNKSEVLTLSEFLGGSSIAGGKMKEEGTVHWASPNVGATNESGYTALPGGRRDPGNGNFTNMGVNYQLWSSSISVWSWVNIIHGFSIYYQTTDLNIGGWESESGCSVRCVKD